MSLIAVTSTQLVSITYSFKPITRHRDYSVLTDVGMNPVCFSWVEYEAPGTLRVMRGSPNKKAQCWCCQLDRVCTHWEMGQGTLAWVIMIMLVDHLPTVGGPISH